MRIVKWHSGGEGGAVSAAVHWFRAKIVTPRHNKYPALSGNRNSVELRFSCQMRKPIDASLIDRGLYRRYFGAAPICWCKVSMSKY